MNLGKLVYLICLLALVVSAVLIPFIGVGIGYLAMVLSSGFGTIACLIMGVAYRDVDLLYLGRIFVLALGISGGLYLAGLTAAAWIYFGSPGGTAVMLIVGLSAVYLVIEMMIKKIFKLNAKTAS